MRPEMPFLAAGLVSLAGGTARERGFPNEGMTAVIGTVALVIVASATADSPIAPLVRAIGLLLLMAAIMAAVPAFTKKGKK
jgi:peptidoglycan/LPS O-acetylase OafA/YrhL